MRTSRVLIFVDESNVVSSVRALGRKLDWLRLRDYLASADRGRDLIEMVIYVGLPPPVPEWEIEREKKNKYLHWLRSNAFLVVAKDGSPGDGKHYKANVDVLMAIDAVELSVEMRPNVVVLVTGDADFAHLALQLRRRGIRVEVAATASTLGTGLKSAANEVIDLVPLFETFELIEIRRIGTVFTPPNFTLSAGLWEWHPGDFAGISAVGKEGRQERPTDLNQSKRSEEGCSSSVRYFGARLWAFLMSSACAVLSAFGGRVVRVATGKPICAKNSSCPAGAQMHSSLAVCSEALMKLCGALAGMLTVSPARTIDFSPRKVTSISPASRVNDSSKS